MEEVAETKENLVRAGFFSNGGEELATLKGKYIAWSELEALPETVKTELEDIDAEEE